MLFEASFTKIYTGGGMVQMELIRKQRNQMEAYLHP
jgi:hypothetical protein